MRIAIPKQKFSALLNRRCRKTQNVIIKSVMAIPHVFRLAFIRGLDKAKVCLVIVF